MSGCIVTDPPTARRSRRRPRSPTRSSSGTRRSRGTSRRPPGRRRRRARAGACAAIASIASCGRSSWIPDRNVPGHTQLTRIPSRAYSTAATFASWITAAFVAQYGAACDHAVRPATDAVRMIDPDCCARMTGTAARMPLTAPRTLTRNARSQSSVARLWMRPFGASTPALLISTSSRPKRSTAERDDGFDLRDLAHVGQQRLDRAATLRQAVDGGFERRVH